LKEIEVSGHYSKEVLDRLNSILEKHNCIAVNPSKRGGEQTMSKKKKGTAAVAEGQASDNLVQQSGEVAPPAVTTQKTRLFLFPIFLKLRGEEKTDEEILAEFKNISDKTDSYLKAKIKFFKDHGAEYKRTGQ
jgi:hypothetical protein